MRESPSPENRTRRGIILRCGRTAHEHRIRPCATAICPSCRPRCVALGIGWPRCETPRSCETPGCVATLAPLPMRSRSTPQHTHVLVLHASRPRLVGSCAAQAEGRHTLRGRQREKRAIARNAGKQVRSVAPSQQVERRSLQGEARRERTVFTRRSIQRLVALLLRLVFSWSRGISFLRPISCGMRARSWRRSRRLRQRACAGRVWTRYARTVAGSGVGTPIRGLGTAGTARL